MNLILTKLITIFASPPASCVHSFFGLIPWFNYLPAKDFGNQGNQTNLQVCDINNNFNILHGNSVALILIAIVDDLLRVAGIVAVGFVLYGAIQFVTSQGNPEETTKARNTIINALVGLVIAMIAIVIVGFIGSQL
jgi:hypothetical protein